MTFRLQKLFLNPQFMKFIVVGGFAAFVNFMSRLLYSQYMSFRLAVVVAYVTGMITAYLLSKYYVFEPSGKRASTEFYHFTLVNLVAVAQVWGISVGLAEYLYPYLDFQFYREEIAHFIGLVVPVFTSYLGHKYLSFKVKGS